MVAHHRPGDVFFASPAWVVRLSTRLRDLASTTGYVADAERHLFDFKQCIVNQYAPVTV